MTKKKTQGSTTKSPAKMARKRVGMGDWEEITLKEAFKFLKTSSHSRSQTCSHSSNAIYVHYGDIHNHNSNIFDFQKRKLNRLLDDIDISKFDALKNSDLIIADASEDYEGIASCFEIKNLNEKAISGLHTFALRPNKQKIAEGFSSLTLKHPITAKYLKKIATGVSVLGVSKVNISRTPIFLPPLSEQKAIANALQTWDTAIEKIEALIDAKERRFGWLVHNLIGQQQYKNVWDKFILEDIFDVSTHFSKSSLICEEGSRYIVDMGSVSRYGDLVISKQTNHREDMLKAEELVMPKDDIGGGNIIGKVAIIDKDNKYICGDHVYRLTPKQKISAYFVKFAINSLPINKRLRAKANGTSQLGLGKKDVLKQPIWLPDLAIQQKISRTLNTDHREIDLLKKLAEQYRTQKRGLMQKLLTGKWRAKTDG